MNRYIDTSVLVTALSNEVRQRELRRWLARQAENTLHISWWTLTEFRSATAKQARIDPTFATEMPKVRATFEALVEQVMTIHPIGKSHFADAGNFAGRPEVNLRASDALHLAVAAAHGLELVTLDRRMASGGAAVGVKTLLL